MGIFSQPLKKTQVKKTTQPTGGGLFSTPISTTVQQTAIEEALQQPEIKESVARLRETVEEPKKIYTGGAISDIFDTLNIFQYGVVGMLKGKGFSEGVRTRQSWSDKDALGDFGIPGMIGGTLLDIAVDPMTYLSPLSILKKIPGVAAGVEAAGTAFKASKIGKELGERFIYGFGKDPVYMKLAERMFNSKAIGERNILQALRGIIDLPIDKASKLLTRDETLHFIRKPLKEIQEFLSPDEFNMVKKAYGQLDDLSKQWSQLNPGKAETINQNIGKYIKNAFEEFEIPKKKGVFDWMKKKIGVQKARKALPMKVREALGEIKNVPYLLGKSMIDLTNDVETSKFFNAVNKIFSSDTALEGFSQLSKNKRLGSLAGKFVPEPLFKDLTEMVRAKTTVEKALNKVVGMWKYGKVILNPAGHARNIPSNFILNSWEGLSPHRLDIYTKGAKELSLFKKGNPGKFVKEILPLGFNTNTFAFNELGGLLGEKGNEHLFKKFGKGFKGVTQKLTDMYGDSESWAKLSQYIFQREGGKGVQEAWNIAERATFNYSQVTPFVRRLRSSMFGFPFITFTAKATPQAIKTALKHPGRISYIGKIKNAIENQADLKELTKERASQPPWIRDGFYVKLPIKDKHGRSAYFDLTYILPFGDLMSGQFLQRQTIKETGLPEGVPSALVRKSPFINLVRELATNKDFYNDKIWKDSDTQHEQLGDIMRHLMKFGLPPAVADTIPGGYDKSGERRPSSIQSILGTKDYKDTQQRTPMQELLRLGGVKISPVNLKVQDEIKDYYDNKAMETLLKEAGIMKDFTKAYIPKQ